MGPAGRRGAGAGARLARRVRRRVGSRQQLGLVPCRRHGVLPLGRRAVGPGGYRARRRTDRGLVRRRRLVHRRRHAELRPLQRLGDAPVPVVVLPHQWLAGGPRSRGALPPPAAAVLVGRGAPGRRRRGAAVPGPVADLPVRGARPVLGGRAVRRHAAGARADPADRQRDAALLPVRGLPARGRDAVDRLARGIPAGPADVLGTRLTVLGGQGLRRAAAAPATRYGGPPRNRCRSSAATSPGSPGHRAG